MLEIRKPRGYWTIETCSEEARKYRFADLFITLIIIIKIRTRTEFQDNSVSAYDAAWRRKWLDDICAHMKEIDHDEEFRKPYGYWNIERCEVEARKYNSRTEFKEMSSSAFNAAWRSKWLNRICSHMDKYHINSSTTLNTHNFQENEIQWLSSIGNNDQGQYIFSNKNNSITVNEESYFPSSNNNSYTGGNLNMSSNYFSTSGGIDYNNQNYQI